MKSNNGDQDPLSDLADKFLLDETRLELWEKLAINLKLKNAINKFALQRKRRNRLYIGGTIAMSIIGLILFGTIQQKASVERLGKTIAGKIIIDNHIVQGTDQPKNSFIANSVVQSDKTLTTYTGRRTEDLTTEGRDKTQQSKNYYLDSLLVRPVKNDLPIEHLQFASYPHSTNGASVTSGAVLKKLPVTIDENDIWDVLQKHADRTYWRKQTQLKDTLKNKLP